MKTRRVAIAAGVAYLVGLGAFAYFAGAHDRFPGDPAASSWVQSWRTGWLDAAMEAVSLVGRNLVAAALVLLTAGVLYVRKRPDVAVLVVLATAVGFAFRTGLKAAIDRPRPDAELVQVLSDLDSASFPSGHVMHYVVLLGTVTFMLSPRMRSGARRWLVQVAVFAALVSIGLSRIYLGVHWLSDVLGGYAFGAAVVVGTLWVWDLWARTREPPLSDDSSTPAA